MRLDQTLKKAHAKHMQGKYEAAVKLYREILQTAPNSLDANYLLGTLYAETGNLAMARQFLEKADSLDRNSPFIKVNLGNICLSEGDHIAAQSYYEQALALKHDLPQAYFGLGSIREVFFNDLEGAADQFKKVLQHFQKALQMTPNDSAMLQAVGKSLFRFANPLALDCFRKSLLINPNLPGINRDYGIACVSFGRSPEGERYLRQALQQNPNDTESRYYLAIAAGALPDQQLQQEYVRSQFDQYAASFDRILVDKLDYSVPEKAIALLTETMGHSCHFARAADLGCGTGLFGVVARSHVTHLAGMDISSAMVEQAQLRNCYDALTVGGIVELLRQSKTTYDLFAAMDVLVYFGELTELFAVLTEKASPGALFIFSTEAYDDGDFTLRHTGRYAHSRAYIAAIAGQAGCSILAEQRIPVRKDRGDWVMGDLYIIRLSPPDDAGAPTGATACQDEF